MRMTNEVGKTNKTKNKNKNKNVTPLVDIETADDDADKVYKQTYTRRANKR